MHPAQLAIEDFLKQCEFRTQRRSGPGGQHRNKVETAVFATHMPTGIVGSSTRERSQAKNRSIAIDRLRVKIAIEFRSSSSKNSGKSSDGSSGTQAFQPGELWKSRSRGKRITISRNHERYPAVLAEAMDCLTFYDWDDVAAAESLDVTRSQLLKLISMEPTALDAFNDSRQKFGLPRLQPK